MRPWWDASRVGHESFSRACRLSLVAFLPPVLFAEAVGPDATVLLCSPDALRIGPGRGLAFAGYLFLGQSGPSRACSRPCRPRADRLHRASGEAEGSLGACGPGGICLRARLGSCC